MLPFVVQAEQKGRLNRERKNATARERARERERERAREGERERERERERARESEKEHARISKFYAHAQGAHRERAHTRTHSPRGCFNGNQQYNLIDVR